jgi:serine/threonine-protein kinase
MVSSEFRTRRVETVRLQLVGCRGPASDTIYDIDRTSVVGRSTTSDIVVEDKALSRRHFRIFCREGGWCVEDLDSANGTTVNGESLEGAVVLKDGDSISAGYCTFETNLMLQMEEDTLDKLLRNSPVAEEHPTSFAGYRVVRRLGEGNMGRLWLVERNGKEFALKHLRRDVTLSEQDRDRFLREAASLRALDHQNIVGFVDSGQDEGQFFYVMQFIDGVDMDVYRRQAGGRLPVHRCLHLMCQVLDGLHYAHQRGFVHRDVKPANVLVGVVDGRMVPKLTDFGLAKRYEAAADMITRGFISFGTPDYMPPEQITAFKEIGPKSDIYAMGATMYHLLSGCTAYQGVVGEDPIRTLLDHEPIPLHERAAWLPHDVCSVIDRAMARDPKMRWSSASRFASRLRTLLAEQSE